MIKGWLNFYYMWLEKQCSDETRKKRSDMIRLNKNPVTNVEKEHWWRILTMNVKKHKMFIWTVTIIFLLNGCYNLFFVVVCNCCLLLVFTRILCVVWWCQQYWIVLPKESRVELKMLHICEVQQKWFHSRTLKKNWQLSCQYLFRICIYLVSWLVSDGEGWAVPHCVLVVEWKCVDTDTVKQSETWVVPVLISRLHVEIWVLKCYWQLWLHANELSQRLTARSSQLTDQKLDTEI